MSEQPDNQKKTLEGSNPRDRKIFNLNAEQWIKLQEALETPPRVLPRMEKLLTEPGYFDSKLQHWDTDHE
jgi:hypothetical protein